MGMMGSGSCSCLPRLFCGRALAVVGLVCLLFIGRSLGSVSEATTLSSSSSSNGRVKQHDDEFVLGHTNTDHHKHVNQQELDFNYMSKRRVPNGPDPIHNRRAGNSGRPPGRA